MKLVFAKSKWEELKDLVRSNQLNGVTGVQVTNDELVAIYEELVANKDSNCVLIGKRYVLIDGVQVSLIVV